MEGKLMQYTKGIQMEEMIFQVGKKLMYEHGYKMTTIGMIAKAADVPHGLVSYYLKKEDFPTRIFMELFKAVDLLIEKELPEVLENNLQKHILRMKIIMTQIFLDKNSRKFYYEINRLNLIPAALHDNIREMQVGILRSLNAGIGQEDYYLCAVAEFGAHKELIEHIIDIQADDPRFEREVELISTIAVRIAGLSPDIVEKNIQEARHLCAKLDYTDIRMF